MGSPSVAYVKRKAAALEREILEGAGIRIVEVSEKELEGGLPPAVLDADAILQTTWRIDRNVIGQLRRCRVVGRSGLGYDNIDVAACTERGIAVVVPRGYGEDDVSDHALAFILAWYRRIVHYDRLVQAGDLNGRVPGRIPRLSTLVAGLCGFGGIARRLAPKLQVLGMRVLAFDPYVPDDVFARAGVERVDFDGLLARSDLISIHSALTPETYHLFDDAAFARMERRPLIVNTARGSIIDTRALERALNAGRVAGACLDVREGVHVAYFQDPDEKHPDGQTHEEVLQRLSRHPEVLLTPLVAYQSDRASEELSRRLAQNVVDVLQGRVPEGLVNPEVAALLGLRPRESRG